MSESLLFAISLVAAIAFAILLTRGMLQRLYPEGEAGCIVVGVLGLSLSILLVLTLTFLIQIPQELIALSTKPIYNATIVSYSAHKENFSNTRPRTSTLYTPIVKFITQDGKTIQLESNHSSGAEPIVGATIKVAYATGDTNAHELSLASVGLLLAGLVLVFLMIYLLYACLQFARGKSMQRIKAFGMGMVLYGIVPTGLLLLSGGMGYAVFRYFSGKKPELSPMAAGSCLFFCLGLLLALVAYIKLLFVKKHRLKTQNQEPVSFSD